MTPKIDAVALVVDPLSTKEESVVSVSGSRSANVIVLSEEDLFLGRSRLKVEKREDVGRFPHHVTGRSETDADSPPIDNYTEYTGMPLDEGIPKKPLYYRFIKRAFDIAFSTCVITIGFIPGLVLCAFVAKDTGGSPIYKSTRVGRNGVPFKILKFRSMVADADDLEKYFTPVQLDEWHREHKVENDPRITRLGAFLRSSSIDEFPQFINVFLGQMATIGSRAVTAEEIEYYGEGKDIILSMRPGITGMWQCGPRNIATFESGLRQKIELSYASSASLALDTKLFFRTFKTMIERTGK